MASMIFAEMRDLSTWAQAVIPPNLPWLPSAIGGKSWVRSNTPMPTICSYWQTAGEATVSHQALEASTSVAFSDRFKLCVKVCHYPPGASKWNPIEHRMFSYISNNWAAQPLTDYETVLKFIRTTKTSAELKSVPPFM